MNTGLDCAVVHLECLDSRRLLAALLAVDGTPALLTDADGSQITVTLHGAGTATVDLIKNRLDVRLADTTGGTDVSIEITGGDGRAASRRINIPSKIGSIDAPALDLCGALKGKSIGALTVRSVTSADVTVGWVGQLSARRITDSTITVDRAGKITVGGDVTGTRLLVSPADDTLVSLKSVNVTGMLAGSSIFALGDIGSVTAAAILNSNVTAGVRILETSTDQKLIQPLPREREYDKLYDFLGKYKIGQVTVTGNIDKPIAFSNSIIGAYQVGTALLNKVDGRALGRTEFGVAAFKLGTVQRFFDQKNVSKNSQQVPEADFVVRQISKPATFDGASGSYGLTITNGSGVIDYTGGATVTFGNLWPTAVSSGTLNLSSGATNSGSLVMSSGTLIINYPGAIQGSTSIGYGSLSPGGSLTLMATDGTKIGTVSSSSWATRDVYLRHDGGFEIRNSAGQAVLAAATLGALAADVFRRSGTSVKFESTGTIQDPASVVTLRSTSTGAVMRFTLLTLSSQKYAGFDEQGQPVGGFVDLTVPPSWRTISVQNREIPSLEDLRGEIQSAGLSTELFTQSLGLVGGGSNPAYRVGSLVGATGAHNVSINSSLKFQSADRSGSNIGLVISGVTANRVGSRRLPAKYVPTFDGVLVYGLPDGSTAVIHELDHGVLNSKGSIRQLPSLDGFKQSLIDADVELRE